jgi:hypothetical protein
VAAAVDLLCADECPWLTSAGKSQLRATHPSPDLVMLLRLLVFVYHHWEPLAAAPAPAATVADGIAPRAQFSLRPFPLAAVTHALTAVGPVFLLDTAAVAPLLRLLAPVLAPDHAALFSRAADADAAADAATAAEAGADTTVVAANDWRMTGGAAFALAYPPLPAATAAAAAAAAEAGAFSRPESAASDATSGSRGVVSGEDASNADSALSTVFAISSYSSTADSAADSATAAAPTSVELPPPRRGRVPVAPSRSCCWRYRCD